MPVVVPVIAAVAAAAASYGGAAAAVSLGIAAAGSFAAAAIGAVVGAVVALGVSYIGSALLGSSAASSNSTQATNRSEQIRQAAAPHQIIMGSVKVSGVLAYIYSPNDGRAEYSSAVKGGAAANYQPNELLYTVVVLSGHPVSSVHDITIDDVPANDAKFYNLAHIESSVGAVDQAANATFIAETDGQWTDASRLRGRAALFCIFDFDTAAFSAVPNPAAIVDGAMPYDPRTGNTVWSDNAALLISWYLQQSFGMRCAYDEIDEPSLIAAANICDEAVGLLDGSSEPRYTINGTFTLDEAPSDVLDKLKASMDGQVIFSGGKWYIFAGATAAPTFTITQDMLRGDITVQANRAAKDSFNAVRATYIRPEANWQATDAPVRYDEAAVAADGGTFYQDFDFPFSTSGFTVQRLMEIALRRNRAERSIQVPLNMAGLCTRAWDVVTFGTDRLPPANYRITDWALSDIGVDLTLQLEPDDIYAWDPTTDQLELGEIGFVVLPQAYTLDAPAMGITTPSTPVPATVEVAVQQVTNAVYAQVQWMPAGSTIWQDAAISGFAAPTSPGGVASFRARDRADERISAWTESAPPPPPTSVTIAGIAGGVALTWTAPTSAVQIFTAGDDSYADSSLAYSGTDSSTNLTITGTPTVYAWIRSVGADGNYSTPLGSVHATAGDPTSGGGAGTPPGTGGGDTGGDGGDGSSGGGGGSG